MAVIYLSSVDGNNADDGSTWALAKATLAAALTAAGAGGTVYVDDAHAETQASAMTLTSPGTAASPTNVICVSRASGAPPTTVATSATVTTTGNTSITFAGYSNVYGIAFSSGTGGTGGSSGILFNSGSAWNWNLDSCGLAMATTSSSSSFIAGSTGVTSAAKLTLHDTVLTFGHVGQQVNIAGAEVVWSNTNSAIGGATFPTTLFTNTVGRTPGPILIHGVDLSALGSGKNLVNVASTVPAWYRFVDCKLGSSVSVTTGSVAGSGGVVVDLINCDSADTNYRYQHTDYNGTTTQETTIIRTGGASDGTTGFSRKCVSSANTNFCNPLAGPWFYFWDETVGSVTAAIEIVTDNVTLTDAEAWVEVDALATSGFPLSGYFTDRAADILATPANQTTSSENWTTTGLGTPVKQTLSKTVTTAEKGWIRCRVMLSKASTTLYACPKVKSTSQYQYMDETGSIINGPAAGGGGGVSALHLGGLGQTGIGSF